MGIRLISSEVPASFDLNQNYPNPFNPSTLISYRLPSAGFVSLKVFDILGNEVETIVNEKQSPGIYEVEFDGSNLSSGFYFYKIEAGAYSKTKKMTLIK